MEHENHLIILLYLIVEIPFDGITSGLSISKQIDPLNKHSISIHNGENGYLWANYMTKRLSIGILDKR